MIIYLVCTFRGILQYTAIYFKEVKRADGSCEVLEPLKRVRPQLFDKSYMQSLLHGFHAWHISLEELKRVEQVQSKSLKESQN